MASNVIPMVETVAPRSFLGGAAEDEVHSPIGRDEQAHRSDRYSGDGYQAGDQAGVEHIVNRAEQVLLQAREVEEQDLGRYAAHAVRVPEDGQRQHHEGDEGEERQQRVVRQGGARVNAADVDEGLDGSPEDDAAPAVRPGAKIGGEFGDGLDDRPPDERRERVERGVNDRYEAGVNRVAGLAVYVVSGPDAALRRAHHDVRGRYSVGAGRLDGLVQDEMGHSNRVVVCSRRAFEERVGYVGGGVEQIAVGGYDAGDDPVDGGGHHVGEVNVEVAGRLGDAYRRLRAGLRVPRAHDRALDGLADSLSHVAAEFARGQNSRGHDVSDERLAELGDRPPPFYYAYDGVADEAGGLAGYLVGDSYRAGHRVHRHPSCPQPETSGAASGRSGKFSEDAGRGFNAVGTGEPGLDVLPYIPKLHKAGQRLSAYGGGDGR